MQLTFQELPFVLPQARVPLDNGIIYSQLAGLVTKQQDASDFVTASMLERVSGLRANTDSYDSMSEARTLLRQLCTLSIFHDMSPIEFEQQESLPRWAFSTGSACSSEALGDSVTAALLSGAAVLSFELTNISYSLGCLCAHEASRASSKKQMELYAKSAYFFDEAACSTVSQSGPMAKLYLSGLAEAMRGLGYESEVRNELQNNIIAVVHAFARTALAYSNAAADFSQLLHTMVDTRCYEFIALEESLASLKSLYYTANTRYHLSKMQAQICVHSTACEALEAQKIITKLKMDLDDRFTEYQQSFDAMSVCVAVDTLFSYVADQVTMFSDPASSTLIDFEGMTRCLCCEGHRQVHNDKLSQEICASLLSSSDQLLEINVLTDKLITCERELKNRTIELEELRSGRTISDSNIFTTEISRLETLVEEQGGEIERLRDYITEQEVGLEAVRVAPMDMSSMLRNKDAEISRLQGLLFGGYGSPLSASLPVPQVRSDNDSQIDELRQLLNKRTDELSKTSKQVEDLTRDLQVLQELYTEAVAHSRSALKDTSLDASVYTLEIERLETQLEEQGNEIERLRNYITDNEMYSCKIPQRLCQEVYSAPDVSRILLGKDNEIVRLQRLIYGLAQSQPQPQPVHTSDAQVRELTDKLAKKAFELQEAYTLLAANSAASPPLDTSIYTIEINRLENLVDEQGEELERLRNYIADITQGTQQMQPLTIALPADDVTRVPTPPADPYDAYLVEEEDVPVVSRVPTPEPREELLCEKTTDVQRVYAHMDDSAELRETIARQQDTIHYLEELLENYRQVPVSVYYTQRDYLKTDSPAVFHAERIPTPEELSVDGWTSDDIPANPREARSMIDYTPVEIPVVERIPTPADSFCDSFLTPVVYPPTDQLDTRSQPVNEEMVRELRRLEDEVVDLQKQISEYADLLRKKDDEIERLVAELEAERQNIKEAIKEVEVIKEVEIVKEVPVYLTSPLASSAIETPADEASIIERLKSKHRYEVANLKDQLDELKNQLEIALTAKPRVVTEYKFSDINYDKLLAEKDEENERLRTVLSIQARSRINANNSLNYGQKAKEAADVAKASLKSMEDKLAAANAAAAHAFASAPQSVQVENLQKKLHEKEKVISGLLQAMTEQKDSFVSLHRAHTLQEEKYSNLCSILREQEEMIQTLMCSPSGTNALTLSTSLRDQRKSYTGGNADQHQHPHQHPDGNRDADIFGSVANAHVC